MSDAHFKTSLARRKPEMNHGDIRKIMKSAVGGGDGAFGKTGENGGTILSLAETFTNRRYRKRRQTTENWRPLTGDRGRIVSGRRSSVSGRRSLLG
jgi:hypothetical protein